MISRVAESCFWLTRYLERVDIWSRMLAVNSSFNLDVALPDAERWRPLVVVVGQEKDFLERIGAKRFEDPEAVQHYLVWDPEQPCSLYSSWRAARENARTVREVMSVELWETVNDTWLWLRSRSAKRLYEKDRDGFYERLGAQCMMFHGICYSTMLHEDPFLFMKLGRAVERTGQTARIMDVKHHALGERSDDAPETTAESAQWLAILRSLSATEPFFQRAGTVLGGSEVAAFLIFDDAFPRSIVHNVERIRGLLRRLRATDPEGLDRRALKRSEKFRRELLALSIDEIQGKGLHEVLTWIVDTTIDVCAVIHDDYFDPPQTLLHQQIQSQPAVAGRSQAQRQA